MMTHPYSIFRKGLASFLLIGFFILPRLGLAAVNFQGLNVPIVGAVELWEIEDYLRIIGNYLIVISIVLAVIFLTWGGITWMASSGEPKKLEEAKSRVKNGIIGAAIVMAVGVIMDTIWAVIQGSFWG